MQNKTFINYYVAIKLLMLYLFSDREQYNNSQMF